MLKREELMTLFDAYNEGEYSFAEILLASGMNLRQFIAFMKENAIEVRFNVGFMDNDRGLDEEALEVILQDFQKGDVE